MGVLYEWQLVYWSPRNIVYNVLTGNLFDAISLGELQMKNLVGEVYLARDGGYMVGGRFG